MHLPHLGDSAFPILLLSLYAAPGLVWLFAVGNLTGRLQFFGDEPSMRHLVPTGMLGGGVTTMDATRWAWSGDYRKLNDPEVTRGVMTIRASKIIWGLMLLALPWLLPWCAAVVDWWNASVAG